MSQSQISLTLRDEAAVARIASLPSFEQFDSRLALGRRVCEEFAFADARSRLQVAGCLKALTALADRRPEIVLPVPKSPAVDRRPPLLASDIAAPEGAPARLARIRDLEIFVVRDRADRTVCITLISREDPHGMTTFSGC